MQRLTDEEVLQEVNELYRQIASRGDASKKKDCKFLGKFDDRYCMATTHDNCRRCRFFEPTLQAKFRALVEENAMLRKEKEILVMGGINGQGTNRKKSEHDSTGQKHDG